MQVENAIQHILYRMHRELSAQLMYHNILHTDDVARQANRIARTEGITDETQLTLLKTAAYYHDAGFMTVYDDHEAESCQIAASVLPTFGYSAEQVEAVCRLIMATRLPQIPTDHLAMILCDADLDYLGREDFFSISPTLFDEWKAYGRLSDPIAWMNIQIRFLENHRYFTTTNQLLREPIKQQHLAVLKAGSELAGQVVT